MYVIVELQGGESPRVKSNQVNFRVIQRYDGKNGSEDVVGGISFEDDFCIWNPMSQYQSGGEAFFECFEGFPAFWNKIPNNFFFSQVCEQNHDIRVVKNESLIEICKSEEGLNVLDFAQFGACLDGLDLVVSH